MRRRSFLLNLIIWFALFILAVLFFPFEADKEVYNFRPILAPWTARRVPFCETTDEMSNWTVECLLTGCDSQPVGLDCLRSWWANDQNGLCLPSSQNVSKLKHSQSNPLKSNPERSNQSNQDSRRWPIDSRKVNYLAQVIRPQRKHNVVINHKAVWLRLRSLETLSQTARVTDFSCLHRTIGEFFFISIDILRLQIWI